MAEMRSRGRAQYLGRKRAKRGRSGAVRPVKRGSTRTAAVKIKNRYAQVGGHLHAQTGTCLASLPSWPCRFDPGHPLHRKTLTQQGFSRAHGRPVLLKRGPWVPSGAVCTRPPWQDQPGKLARQHGPRQPPERSDPPDCPPPLRDRRRGTGCAAAAFGLLVERPLSGVEASFMV